MDVRQPHPDLGKIMPTPVVRQFAAKNPLLANAVSVPDSVPSEDFLTDLKHEDWGGIGGAAFQADVVHRVSARVRDALIAAPKAAVLLHKPDPVQSQAALCATQPAKETHRPTMVAKPVVHKPHQTTPH